ncbi:hypothetical protein EDB81DRAFT_692084 [Dactylonectria macrodidyma]|uniref:MYND-type domain-containing protein n=1 Tax=Dactylonectria macrodidyma TaxID=307937 RepID=A0A9P9J0F2_9HYPO|nr:hypothetical protein EDB81DRAFT_692084 [Dactylonectria macrodidyma]
MNNNPGVPITEPRCPVQDEDKEYCHGTPQVPCPECFLIAYCSDECRRFHWTSHNRSCVGPLRRRVLDDLNDKNINQLREDPCYWAKHAATDVLDLARNEGKEFDGTLELLLVGESSLRHLMYTICKLPDTAKPKIKATINETSSHHLARLVLTVLLLTDDSNDPLTNAETVVHLWYSAKMPSSMVQHVEHVAGEILRIALADLEFLHENGRVPKDMPFPITLPRGGSQGTTVEIDINRQQWWQVNKYLSRTKNVGKRDCKWFRERDCRNYTESLASIKRRMTHARVAGMKRWRADGLLLPYGHPREEFDTPNPYVFSLELDGRSLFFQDNSLYPIGATQEPLAEWPMKELLNYDCGPALNDVYGKMFYYVRNMCLTFQQRIKSLKSHIRINSMAIHTLAVHLGRGSVRLQFDRIEAAHYWDKRPFITMVSLGTLLRHEDENPNATLLTLTRKTVDHNLQSVAADLYQERQLMCIENGTKLDELAPPISLGAPKYHPRNTRRELGLLVWRNWDKFSDRYLASEHYFNLLNVLADVEQPERGLTATKFFGIGLKRKNTITSRWPNRIVHKRTDAPSLLDFNRWLGWTDVRPERWLEWKRFGDVSDEAWGQFFKLSSIEDSEIMSEAAAKKEVEAAIRKAIQDKLEKIDAPMQRSNEENEGTK